MAKLKLLLSLCALLSLLPGARAEGLLQLSLQGEVVRKGGAHVEVDLHFTPRETPDDERVMLATRLHLAQHTTAQDFAALLAARLEAIEVGVVFTGRGPGQRPQLFIQGVSGIELRLGHGLSAIVTLAHSAPSSLRLDVPKVQPGKASLSITTSTHHAHTGEYGLKELELSIGEDWSGAQIAQRLSELALLKGLVPERPGPDRWRIEKAEDGSQLVGCSIELDSPEADWKLEVWL